MKNRAYRLNLDRQKIRKLIAEGKVERQLSGKEVQMVYRIVVEKGEDFGYIAHCPAIPGCHSQGNTIEETIEKIKDAIRGCLSAMPIFPSKGLMSY